MAATAATAAATAAAPPATEFKIGSKHEVGLSIAWTHDSDRDSISFPTAPLRKLTAGDEPAMIALVRAESAAGNPHAICCLGWLVLFGIGETIDNTFRPAEAEATEALIAGEGDPTDFSAFRSPFSAADNASDALPLFELAAQRGSLMAANNVIVCKTKVYPGFHETEREQRDARFVAAYEAFQALIERHPKLEADNPDSHTAILMIHANVARTPFLGLPPYTNADAEIEAVYSAILKSPVLSQRLDFQPLHQMLGTLLLIGCGVDGGQCDANAQRGMALLEASARRDDDPCTGCISTLFQAYVQSFPEDDKYNVAGRAPGGASNAKMADWAQYGGEILGNGTLLYELSLMYADGSAGQTDEEKAMECCRRSAVQGLAHAQVSYGVSISETDGGGTEEASLILTVLWWRRAAAQRSARALANLAMFGRPHAPHSKHMEWRARNTLYATYDPPWNGDHTAERAAKWAKAGIICRWSTVVTLLRLSTLISGNSDASQSSEVGTYTLGRLYLGDRPDCFDDPDSDLQPHLLRGVECLRQAADQRQTDAIADLIVLSRNQP